MAIPTVIRFVAFVDGLMEIIAGKMQASEGLSRHE
jgi:hypothetical protein